MVFNILGCDGNCDCDISLMHNAQDFTKKVLMGKDTAPKLKFEISNTKLDYAYGTQLNISTELQLKNEDLVNKDCTKKAKVIHISIFLYHHHAFNTGLLSFVVKVNCHFKFV